MYTKQFAASLVTSMVSLLALASACGPADSEPTPVPDYQDREVQGTILGQDWQVKSARVRSGGETDNLVIELYGAEHEDLCSELTPQSPSPTAGERALHISDLAPEQGEQQFAGSAEENDPDESTAELDFWKYDESDNSWGGQPYGRGSIDIVELSGDRVRAEIVGAQGHDEANKISGWFEAERCGCVGC